MKTLREPTLLKGRIELRWERRGSVRNVFWYAAGRDHSVLADAITAVRRELRREA